MKNSKYLAHSFIFLFLFLVVFLISPIKTFAANRYWVGGSDGANTNDSANWSSVNPTSCTGGGASVPGSADVAIFDADCDNGATINANWSVAGINMNSGYTGTVTQSSSITLTVGTSDYIQAGGIFVGGNSLITFGDAFTVSGGTFTINNAPVEFGDTSGAITGTVTFKDVTFNISTASRAKVITNTITITDSLNINTTGTGDLDLNTGTINIEGDINLTSGAGTGGGGSATMIINGTGDQTITSTGAGGTATLPNVNINKSSGTLYLEGIISTSGTTWTYTSGTIDAGDSTIYFNSTNRTITGSHTLNNVTFASATAGRTQTINTGTTLTVSGDMELDITNSATLNFNTGTINIEGNLNIDSSAGGVGGGGSATFNINGTGDQTITGSGQGGTGALPVVNIDKPSGTLFFIGTVSASGASWTYTQGAIDPGDSTIYFNSAIRTITGSHELNNVTFASLTSSRIQTISSGTVLTVGGDLNIIVSGGGINNLTFNTGDIHLKGDVTITSDSTAAGGGTGTFTINGTGDQTITGPGTGGIGSLPDFVINKPSGTLYLAGIISSAGDWTYTAGTIDPGSSTVQFGTIQTIDGSHTLNNVAFVTSTNNRTITITSGTTLTLNGNLDITTTGTGYFNFNTGNIDVKGNISMSSGTGVSTGSATISLIGSAAQTISKSGNAFTFPMAVNKTNNSDTVTLATNFSTASTLTITKGIFSQGASYDLASGAISVGANGTWENLGTGDITLSGDVSNAGTITLNSNGSSCGDSDSIVLTSSASAQRAWSGAGTFNLFDLAISWMSGSMTAYSSTDSGNNSSWTINAGCPNANPNTPSSLGSSGLVDGSYTTDTTPTLTFDLSDSNGSDTVKYRIQIDDTSNFSSPVVDYTSALAAQGSFSFTVGQAAGSGTYTTGAESQTFSDASYYWRVKAIDNSDAESSYATANSGDIAFNLDATAPSAPSTPDLTSESDSGVSDTDNITTDTTPTFSITCEDDATVSLLEDATELGTETCVGGTVSITSSALSEGVHLIKTSQEDEVGNVSSESSTISITIDTTVPTAGSINTIEITATTITISSTGASDAGSGLALLPYNFRNITTDSYSGLTDSSAEFVGLIPSTTYSFEIGVYDLAGNSATTSSVDLITLALPVEEDEPQASSANRRQFTRTEVPPPPSYIPNFLLPPSVVIPPQNIIIEPTRPEPVSEQIPEEREEGDPIIVTPAPLVPPEPNILTKAGFAIHDTYLATKNTLENTLSSFGQVTTNSYTKTKALFIALGGSIADNTINTWNGVKTVTIHGFETSLNLVNGIGLVITDSQVKLTDVIDQTLEDGTQLIKLSLETVENVAGGTVSIAKEVSSRYRSLRERLAEEQAKQEEPDPRLPEELRDHRYEEVTIRLATAEGRPMYGAKLTLFSEPKEAITNESGEATFHDVETGEHTLAISFGEFRGSQKLFFNHDVPSLSVYVVPELREGMNPIWLVATFIMGLVMMWGIDRHTFRKFS